MNALVILAQIASAAVGGKFLIGRPLEIVGRNVNLELVWAVGARPAQRYVTSKPCARCGVKTSVLASPAQGRGSWRNRLGDTVLFSEPVLVTAEGRILGTNDYSAQLPCRGCGVIRYAPSVVGKLNPRKRCTARCESATGHDCECACGGKNHGAAHAA